MPTTSCSLTEDDGGEREHSASVSFTYSLRLWCQQFTLNLMTHARVIRHWWALTHSATDPWKPCPFLYINMRWWTQKREILKGLLSWKHTINTITRGGSQSLRSNAHLWNYHRTVSLVVWGTKNQLWKKRNGQFHKIWKQWHRAYQHGDQ